MNPAAAAAAASASATTEPVAAVAQQQKKPCRDDFKFGKLLGEGAYSQVVEAELVSDGFFAPRGTRYAVKIVDKGFVVKMKKVHTVQIEKQVLTMLSGHPLICRLAFTFRDPRNLYFVLELATGGELTHLIRRFKASGALMPPEMARFYLAETIVALEHMHRKGIVHRDLKPENVLIHEDGHIRLTDFGTCHLLGQANEKFVGTALYVSPEMLEGERESDMGADLWALGCVLFQLLTNEPPFHAASEYLTFLDIKARKFAFPESGFPEDARDLVDRLLCLEPQSRIGYGSSEDEYAGYEELKAHPFFAGVRWSDLHREAPPAFDLPPLPEGALADDSQSAAAACDSSDDDEFAEISQETKAFDKISKVPVGAANHAESGSHKSTSGAKPPTAMVDADAMWRPFLLPEETIEFRGLVEKTGVGPGRFRWRERMLVLTSFPRFFYVDCKSMTLKGEIPWSDKLWCDYRNDRRFDVHTPTRVYRFRGLETGARSWTDAIVVIKRSQRA